VSTGPIPVAFVSSHARDGGAERHLERVVEAIDPRWVAVVVSLEDGPLPRRAADLGHRTVVIETGNRRRDLVVSAVRLRRALTAARPRVVCASGIKAAAVAGIATLGSGIPVVWLKVDFSFDGRTARLVARRCAIVAGVSRAVLATFPPQLAPRLRVVYNGVPDVHVDRRRGHQRVVQSFGGAPPERVVGLVGRLDPSKGHRQLVESAPAIIERVPGTGFLLVGGANPDSDYARALQRLARELGVEDAVRFVAHTDEVAEIMAGLDLLVHASVRPPGYVDTEGFPLVALEAMLAGVPVVGYGNGGLPELVGTTGRVVPPGDRQALTDAIVELLANDEVRADLGAKAQARVRSSFLLPASIDALEACLRAAGG